MRRPLPLAAALVVVLGSAAVAGSPPATPTGALRVLPASPTLDPAGLVDLVHVRAGGSDDGTASADAASAAGRHVVTVRVAADEEWRSQLGTLWRDVATSAIERADDRMAEVFGIDLRVRSFAGYTSDDALGGDTCALLQDLAREVRPRGADVVLGFFGQGAHGGCAYRYGSYAAVVRSSTYEEWKVVQHEVSHLFGADDRYIRVAGDDPDHEDDVMEDPFRAPDRWASPDYEIVRENRARFDG